MQTTTNYGLKKPEGATDNVLISDLNENADIIDAEIKDLNDNKEALIKNTSAKTTLVDADTLPLSDSEALLASKRITFANVKAVLKAYFDMLYNNYVHPTTAGNKHIPTGGASNQVLKYSASGTAAWGTDNDTITLVVDSITSTDTNKALSANQGKVLGDLVSTISGLSATQTSFGTNTVTEDKGTNGVLVTTFNANSTITEVLTKNSIVTTKTTTFNADGSISEVIS